MPHTTALVAIRSTPHSDVDLAAASYLGGYTGKTREAYATDVRKFLEWCDANQLHPFQAKRAHIEIFVRWLQDVRKLAPSTVSRKVSVVVGFYRSAAIDEFIVASPAEYIRRPKVPFESPTLGLTHLQFEAVIRESRNRVMDHALIMLLGMLGLRVSEACNISIEHIGYEHGHRVVKVFGKGGTIVQMPMPPAIARAVDLAMGERTSGPLLLNRRNKRLTRADATTIVKRVALKAGVTQRVSPHSMRHTMVTTMLDAGVSLRDVQIAARHADPRTTTRYDRARNNLDRHGVYALAAFMGGAT